MNLVDNVQFEAAGCRRVRGSVAQFANLIHAIIAGSVNFQHVKRPALGNLHTALIIVLEIHRGPVGRVQALGKNSRDGRFAGAARAAEKIGMRNASGGNGITESLGDVLLTHHFGKPLRPVSAGYDLI